MPGVFAVGGLDSALVIPHGRDKIIPTQYIGKMTMENKVFTFFILQSLVKRSQMADARYHALVKKYRRIPNFP